MNVKNVKDFDVLYANMSQAFKNNASLKHSFYIWLKKINAFME